MGSHGLGNIPKKNNDCLTASLTHKPNFFRLGPRPSDAQLTKSQFQAQHFGTNQTFFGPSCPFGACRSMFSTSKGYIIASPTKAFWPKKQPYILGHSLGVFPMRKYLINPFHQNYAFWPKKRTFLPLNSPLVIWAKYWPKSSVTKINGKLCTIWEYQNASNIT